MFDREIVNASDVDTHPAGRATGNSYARAVAFELAGFANVRAIGITASVNGRNTSKTARPSRKVCHTGDFSGASSITSRGARFFTKAQAPKRISWLPPDDVRRAVQRFTGMIHALKRFFNELTALELKQRIGADRARYDSERAELIRKLDRVYDAIYTGFITATC